MSASGTESIPTSLKSRKCLLRQFQRSASFVVVLCMLSIGRRSLKLLSETMKNRAEKNASPASYGYKNRMQVMNKERH